MKRLYVMFSIGLLMGLLYACSDNGQDASSDGATDDMVTEQQEAADSSSEEAGTGFVESTEESADEEMVEPEPNRDQMPELQMIIYTGHLRVEVDDFSAMQDTVQQHVNEMDGYIVESEVFESEEGESRRGRLQIRVPQEHFNAFMDNVEEHSANVLEKVTSGDDVSDQYVDLESRLRSQEAVEERLLEFMDQAESTEDLLKISNDFTEVQEQIEQIKGRMEYLDNQVAYSTITINIEEKQVNISELQNQDDLNTGERAQSLFMDTIIFLINIGSGIAVFLIGMSPVLIPAVVIVGGMLWVRRRKKKKAETVKSNKKDES